LYRSNDALIAAAIRLGLKMEPYLDGGPNVAIGVLSPDVGEQIAKTEKISLGKLHGRIYLVPT